MASKRGDKRRRKQRARRPPAPAAPPRLMSGPGDWDRAREEGRMMVIMPSDLSPAEQEARQQEIVESIEHWRRQFAPAKANLLAALAPHDAFDLLSALQVAFAGDWPRGKAPILHGMQAVPELLALLLVERGSCAPTAVRGNEEQFVAASEQFGQFAHGLLSVTPDALVLPPMPADRSPEGALAEIRNRMTALHLLSPLHETDSQGGPGDPRPFRPRSSPRPSPGGAAARCRGPAPPHRFRRRLDRPGL